MSITPTWRRPVRECGDGSDPYFNSVSLLMTFDGANGSNTFVDKSKNNITLTAINSAQISTTQSKFGGSSGYFAPNGSYVQLPATSPVISLFSFGSADFTIETWIYPLAPATNTYGVERTIFGMWSAVVAGAQGYMLYLDGGSLKFIADLVSNDNVIFNVPSVITTEKWYHVAVTRSGSSMYLFVDGVVVGTYNPGGSGFSMGSNNFGVGGYNRDYGTSNTATFNGYLDSLRVTKGFARYTQAFSVPTLEFPNF